MRCARVIVAAAFVSLVLAAPAWAPTEELYGNYNFFARLAPTEPGSDARPVSALLGLTDERTCVKLQGRGLPGGATASVSLVSATGKTVKVYEDGFSIRPRGRLNTTQCVSLDEQDDWISSFKRRPGRYTLELRVKGDPDVVYSGKVAKRPKPR
jgi:hypothetical protein